MTVRPPGQAVQTQEFKIVGQALLVVYKMFKDEPRIHDISRIDRGVVLTARSGIRIEDRRTDTKRLEVFAIHHAFGEPQFAEPCGGQSTDGETLRAVFPCRSIGWSGGRVD